MRRRTQPDRRLRAALTVLERSDTSELADIIGELSEDSATRRS